MKNNLLKTISPTVRLLLAIIILFCIIMAKSLYLYLAITTLILMIYIVSNLTVKQCVKCLKKVAFSLIILLSLYIIIVVILERFSIVGVLLFVYKEVLCIIALKSFDEAFTFNDLSSAIYGIFPMKSQKSEKLALDFAYSIYFFKYWLNSHNEIVRLQHENGFKFAFFRGYFLSRLMYSFNSLYKLQLRTKLNFYTLQYSPSNFKSKVFLAFFIVFLVLCVIKEVIL